MHYNLIISGYGHGDEIKADLTRYYGNTALLNVIKDELSKQLEELKAEFDAL